MTNRDLDEGIKLTVGVLVTLERGILLSTDDQLRKRAAALHFSDRAHHAATAGQLPVPFR